MLRASIDIGSNSVLLLLAEWDEKQNKIRDILLNLSHITSLGKDLDKNKAFREDSMQATYHALEDYKSQLQKFNFTPENVIATATEAARVATNSKSFFEKIRLDLGFSIQLISAEGEAYYTALGVVSGQELEANSIVVMDMGGASTELINITTKPFHIKSSISFPVGSVRATDWSAQGDFASRMQAILSRDLTLFQTPNLVCVAGGMTSLASMYIGAFEYNDKLIDGLKIEFSSFKKFSYDLTKTNPESILFRFPYLGKRAPMLAAASEVAVQIGEKLAIEQITISTRGLRFGTLFQGGIDERYRS